MNIKIQNSKFKIQNSIIKITGSKSETNRLLLLQALYPNINLENTSNSDDSEVMMSILNNSKLKTQNSKLFDVHHAGTAMRFLTAFFATQENQTVILTGSFRMRERPIKMLVDALRQLGSNIEYVSEMGFPPIKIIGAKITKNQVSIPANVSSQYISALLLIAPKLENGLELTLDGAITSVPYIKMTLALLNEIGVETSFEKNIISVLPKTYNLQPAKLIIESDWSSASYYYSIIALSELKSQIKLSNFKENSFQGDAVLSEIYTHFGVQTTFDDNTLTITKVANIFKSFNRNLNHCPDIAQTIAVTCFGLGISCELSGLKTLKIKETDRLLALEKELTKLGARIFITDQSIRIAPSTKINSNITIKTYDDHRMAMAFAPLALKTTLIIENSEVVSKSYPEFWKDLQAIGFEVKQMD